MATIHSILEAQGKAAALAAGLERTVVEAASLYMADEDGAFGFVYSGWAQCALPHRRLADDAAWEIGADRLRLVVEPGRRPSRNDGPLEWVGVPFGAHARLILLYLQTQALKTGSRDIELGHSLRDWLRRIGVSVGGRTGLLVKEQAERISRCRLTFHLQGKTSGLINQSIVDRALFIEDANGHQGSFTLETAKLSEGFFEQLCRHPVPLEEAAIRAINNNPAALDAYLWLAYRLHSLTGPKLVTWKALKSQFGVGFKELHHFKHKWRETLNLALAVYPAANVEIEEAGVLLKPSRPPVAPRQMQLR
jgi:hypothetical protein